MIWLTLGLLLTSSAAAYAWWVSLRVVLLRQDILDLRDGLFDAARELDALADPAHRSVRGHLNKVAAHADDITVPVVAFILYRGLDKSGVTPCFHTNNPELQAAIDHAMEESAHVVGRHLLRRTFTGAIILPMASFVRLGHELEQQTIRWARRWVFSAAAEQISEVRLARPDA